MVSSRSIRTGKVVIKPRRSFGQNFLVDENIARKIITSADISTQDVVIEIGPGQGALTKYLIDQAKKVYAIEIDERAINLLKENFPQDNLIFVNEDFLNLDIQNIYKKEKRKIKLIGNIPYNITSQILFKVVDDRRYFDYCIFMMQREVAQRIVAKTHTKDYGILSVILQYYSKPEILFKVSPTCFYPKPKVTSAVVKLNFFEALNTDINEEIFRLIVRTSFGKRRKTLKNSLKYLPFYCEIESKLALFKKFSLDKRPEELSIEQFIELTRFISGKND